MNIFKKIVCPVDFSEYSSLALTYAVALARENDAALYVCHSIPDLTQTISYMEQNYISTVEEALTSTAMEKMDQFMKGIATEGLQVTKMIDRGNPAEMILKAASDIAADLVVMGTHGHSGYEKFFVGSVTNRVLYKTTRPVLAVCRPSHNFVTTDGSYRVELNKILCALDFGANNREIAKLALDIARMHNAEITFLHAVPKGVINEVQPDRFGDFVDSNQAKDCNVHFLIKTGEPCEAILDLVRKTGIDLVVLGHHSRRPIEEIFLGSVAKRVVTDCICPVLVARSTLDISTAESIPEMLEAFHRSREATTGA